MPIVLVSAVEELIASANLAFRLCPMLTQGATEAIAQCGSPGQQALYLPRMVRGEWTGTMNLTESQAGSDLAQVRTRAVPRGDHYRIHGQKIFITYGEHDLAANIIHMVLARIEGAPAGVKGISLFIVPKFLVNADGSLGARNDLKCISIEHKLGIRGSPTCTMVYGQGDGAVGYLLGEAHHGLEYMFIMMNAARLSVGLEGYAVAERAYQQRARLGAHPNTRPPHWPAGAGGRAADRPSPGRAAHAAHDEGADRGDALSDPVYGHPARRRCSASRPCDTPGGEVRGELLIPIVKGWCTECGVEVASLGIQVHGGMGFIEETGAAQPLRDARIGPIYEGTTGIQAGDLHRPQARQGRGCGIHGLGGRYP